MAQFVDENELIYLKYGFSIGVILTIVAYLFTFLTSSFIGVTTSVSMLSILKVYILSNLIFVVVYPFVLYQVIKKVDSVVQDLNKFSVALYVLGGIILTNSVITSLIEKRIAFGNVGLLPIFLTFIVPFFYKSNKI